MTGVKKTKKTQRESISAKIAPSKDPSTLVKRPIVSDQETS